MAVASGEAMEQILNYAPNPPPNRSQLTMTETDGAVVITFPVPGKWMRRLALTGQFMMVIGPAGHVVVLLWVWRQFFAAFRVALPAQFITAIVIHTLLTIIMGLLAAHHLTMHFRWGSVPRVLKARRDLLTLSWLGFRRMRERSWRAADICSIDQKTMRDVFTRKELYRLRIRLRSGWRRQILMRTTDPKLAADIYESFCMVLPWTGGSIHPDQFPGQR